MSIVVLAGLFLLLPYPKVYILRGSAGGVLYWNTNEAVLFMTGGSSGARMSPFRYTLEPVLESLRNVRSPDDERCSQVMVIRVTDKDVQRYETDLYHYASEPYCGFHYVLFEGQFYAVSGPSLWKWSGTSFERPTPEEYGAYPAGGGKTVSQHPWYFDSVDGWSMRELGSVGPQYQFKGRPVTVTQLTLNGQPVSFVFSGETFPQMPISVDLLRSGQGPLTIWSFDGRPHRVSKAEYERVFPPSR
jgi:hypothetical protein